MPSFTDLSNRLTIMISQHASLVFKNENVVFDIHRYCQQKKFDCQTMGEGKFHHCFSNPLFASFYIIWTKLDWLWSILMRIPNDKLVQTSESDSTSTVTLSLSKPTPCKSSNTLVLLKMSILYDTHTNTTKHKKAQEVSLKF